MYYESEVEGVVRVSPELFSQELKEAVMSQLKKDYEGQCDFTLGRVFMILDVLNIGEGIIIAGDGAAYYKVKFKAMHFVPDVQEIIEGEVKDIAKFGAFVDFGPFEGMVHISQSMDDFVSLDEKTHVLTGKESKHTLKVGDYVRARIIAVSYKDPNNPKIGLTMRQMMMGKPEWWVEKPKVAKKAPAKKATKK